MKIELALALLVLPMLSCSTSRPSATRPVTEVDGYADVNGVRLHYVSQGTGPLILFVHGFPEFWYAWRSQLAEFGRDHQAVAMDMRGYNLSSKPQAVAAYRMPNMVQDILALADHLGARKFVLVGHDWGGAVAWAFAMAHPDRLEKLVIINAPHPTVFGRELSTNPAQQRASAYMTSFQSTETEQQLSADSYAALMHSTLADVIKAGYLTAADSVEYIKAWSQPGALTGGLNYYRAARIGLSTSDAPTLAMMVAVPTLVIWGERDRYLLAGNLNGLEAYVPRLTIKRIADATHWVVHERPAEVNALIREFIR